MLFFLALCIFNTSLTLASSGLPLSRHSDRVVGSEHLEREPPELYPSRSSMHPYYPVRLGYQDAALTTGIPLQQGYQHASCSHYCGAALVSPIPEFLRSSLSQPPLLLLQILNPRKPIGVSTLCQALSTGRRDTTLTLDSKHLWECARVDRSVHVLVHQPGLSQVLFRAVG